MKKALAFHPLPAPSNPRRSFPTVRATEVVLRTFHLDPRGFQEIVTLKITHVSKVAENQTVLSVLFYFVPSSLACREQTPRSFQMARLKLRQVKHRVELTWNKLMKQSFSSGLFQTCAPSCCLLVDLSAIVEFLLQPFAILICLDLR